MDGPRPCGCKGCRTCLICEKEFKLNEKPYISEYKVHNIFLIRKFESKKCQMLKLFFMNHVSFSDIKKLCLLLQMQ